MRRFIDQRQPHEGPLHALLVTGVLGAFFFSAFCFAFILYVVRSINITPPKEIAPIQVWCFALLFPQVLGFLFLFGDYTFFLMQVCPITALLVRTETFRRASLKTRPTLAPAPSPYPPSLPSPQLRRRNFPFLHSTFILPGSITLTTKLKHSRREFASLSKAVLYSCPQNWMKDPLPPQDPLHQTHCHPPPFYQSGSTALSLSHYRSTVLCGMYFP